ncbi:hypothetical protein H7F15_05620 [Pontibacter sp. Tf4]|uniref:hypothetical protein n=1 Tax=Pontibacter sp. Tf4 TaxID=2761620 RepID=UPI0016235AAC|nr:hypothetical protein [Pontibacter sp. Tf4]MBB6610506.1 hypothetical protein [Pontibacter sp. Tf4]
MQTNLNGHPDKYGVTATVRIPADLKRELSDEAAVRGISFAQYGASILMGSHKRAAEQSTQVDLLLRERRQLQEQAAKQKQRLEAQIQHIARLEQTIKKLKSQAPVQRETDKLILSKLQQNRHILEQFLAGSTTGVTISQAALGNAGFDVRYATTTVQYQGKQYICVYDVCYCQEGDMVFIDILDPRTLC